jgi:hypothetical protein
MIPSRFVNGEAARARFGDRVDRIAAYLMASDPLADALVETIETSGGQAYRDFEKAAARGIASLDRPPPSFRAFFAQTEHVPPWVDWETLDRGGEVLLRAGPLGGLVLATKSLVLGYAAPGGNKPLAFSGRLEKQAARRLNETAKFVQATCSPGGLRPTAEAYQITLKVRLIHAQVRRMLLRSPKWDTGRWGIPANQHDLVGTSLLFSVIVLQGLRQLGLQVSAEDGERYMQLFRYSGYLSGVDPELQPASEAEAVRLGDVIEMTQGAPDEDARRLTRALLDSPLEAARTRTGRRNAEHQRDFATAMCRELIGHDRADQLGLPRTTYRYMVPFFRRLVSSVELVRTSVPLRAADGPALWAGRRYWDRVVEIGLAGAMADFALPTRLAAA